MVSKKPDFKKAYVLANEILVSSDALTSFPFSTKQIVKKWSDIRVLPFKCAHEYGIDIEAFGSESAVILEKCGRYLILYNQEEYAPRVKFSILHEFGHYYLGHFPKEHYEEDEYGRIEVETNFFAAQILMPEQILNELKKRGAVISVEFLQRHFGVSEEAAQKRIAIMGKVNYEWRSSEEKFFDEAILFKYKDFIDAILPKRNINSWYEDELEKQAERDTWDSDTRTRYRY